MSTVADLIVCELKRAGVQTLFGVPGGGSNLDLIAAAGNAGLPFVLTATETAGAIAALAQAEVTGRLGACLTTLGPGAASVVNGVACAFLDRAPLVVFTDSHAASARGAFEHQRLDQAALLTPITKWSATLTAGDARRAFVHAITIASSGRPGPVHLECPGEVASAQAATSESASAISDGPRATPVNQESLSPGTSNYYSALAAERANFDSRLHGARKPLLLVGLGARHPEGAKAIRSLCETRHVPAMVTYKAKGIVPDDHPWFAGVFTNATIEQPLIDDSDLLIGLGLDPVELLPRAWTRKPPIVYCGPWPVEDAHVPFAAQHVTAASDGAQHIEKSLTQSDWDPRHVRAHVDRQRERIALPANGLTAQLVVEMAAVRLARAAGRVTVDAGAHMLPATMLWPVSEPNGMLISNGLSTMGFALPAAIGAALLDREKPVVALTGDGGLLMCAGELLTAVRERLRLIVVVFNDASLSLIEIKQQARALPPDGVLLGAVDWAALAKSFGLTAFVADNETALDRAIEQAMACDGPSLVEATIDRSNYGDMLRAVRG